MGSPSQSYGASPAIVAGCFITDRFITKTVTTSVIVFNSSFTMIYDKCIYYKEKCPDDLLIVI